jgi:opacity protein-like surface antigen
MKLIVAGLVGMLALSGVAYAQSAESRGYVEGVAQAAFGNVTSQSYGAEGGLNLTPRVAIFAEFGMTLDTAPASIGTAAQTIAGYLAQVQSAPVSYTVKQPLGFGIAGVRYTIPSSERVQPYVLGGAGVGRVKRDVTFTVGGTDVTDNLDDYGVVLGSDLSGTETKLMISAGGGVVWKAGKAFFVDLGYRFGSTFTDTSATNVNRVGVGLGLSF